MYIKISELSSIANIKIGEKKQDFADQIYIYIYMCVCVCVFSFLGLRDHLISITYIMHPTT